MSRLIFFPFIFLLLILLSFSKERPAAHYTDKQAFTTFPDSAKAECEPMIPNTFTPNGDGINDCIKASNTDCIVSLECTFYDRWGTVVYETSDPAFCWDARDKKGTLLGEGVYYYVYDGISARGIKVSLKGNITILR